MITGSRLLLFCVWCCVVTLACAQGGIRLIVYNYEPLFEGGSLAAHYGIGYDHDLNERVSSAWTARLDPGNDSYVLNYRSAYHFSDNDRGSFYFGPSVGVRRFTVEGSPTLMPVGLRAGVRGGLERFYADLYAGFQYNAGSGKSFSETGQYAGVDLRAATYTIGLDFGWGWARNTRKGAQR
ncbi:MAG: hypothetical protein KDC00_04950 [Flavobacteriales bacterium]|nr:hypothetical protein [Flavobacteriales bacterium]